MTRPPALVAASHGTSSPEGRTDASPPEPLVELVLDRYFEAAALTRAA
ncbi:hypothetical protein [Agromyces ramosus]|uniref:Uncharacterized protein n=1 Tax=Agromyces ramosus TaxID=33879 RepID=A0ABU0R3I7_9MICO|nr:hypothetical protein [Agromyces ramosus]MDQ0892630.1 hypothetical protein [Agromyces ramosus]